MAVLKRFGGCGAALFVWGCGAATAPIHPAEASVAVHAVLAAGTDTARVLLTRYDPDAPADMRFSRISGAAVRVARAGDTLQLPEAPAGFRDCDSDPFQPDAGEPARPGCYGGIVPGGLREGERYALRITLPGGGSVGGAATIPSRPEILAPAAGRIVLVRTPDGPATGGPGSSFPVRWKAPEAGRIEIAIVRPQAFRGGRALTDVQCSVRQGPLPDELVRADSVLHQVVSAFCSRGGEGVRWDSISVMMMVTAYDTTYARFARDAVSKESVRRERASAGLVGAYGVFAGAASAERRLTLVPAQ
jgi:hypothetical protein